MYPQTLQVAVSSFIVGLPSMRLLVLVPTSIHKVTAGSRIRYDRLGTADERFEITVESFEEVTAATLETCDICIFSKTYSVEAITLAHQLRQAGKLIGIDVFDDYFSQIDDPRLLRFRMWLRCMAQLCQFALCSTNVMHDIVKHNAPGLPVHVVPDPFAEIDPASLAQTLASKLDRARTEGTIDVLWFGNGSNPFFTVGLHDIAAYCSSLADLASGSRGVSLTILTDGPSQTPANLALLTKLPVPYLLDTWSVEGERKALERAFVSFIPVNGQSFSRAKSFNRALTAISAGTQVLSPGFPLYRDLDPAIYTDALELLSDLDRGKFRLRGENVHEIAKTASRLSDSRMVANNLFLFLNDLSQVGGVGQGNKMAAAPSLPTQGIRRRLVTASPSTHLPSPETHALIYGFEYNGLMVRAAKATGILQVKTPFARRERAYDIQIEHRKGRQLEVWIEPRISSLLAEALRGKCSEPQRVGKVRMLKVDVGTAGLLARDPIVATSDLRMIVNETDSYRKFLIDVQRVCTGLFPTVQFSVADMEAHFNNRSTQLIQVT